MSEQHNLAGTPQPIEVAAVLVFRHGQLLISRRRAQDHLGGLWEFPGGKREHAETFEQCLRRELHEELGVCVEVGALIESITHDYPGKRVHLRFFRCRLAAGEPEPRPLGCAAVAWVCLAELARYDFPAADARLLERVKSDHGLWAD